LPALTSLDSWRTVATLHSLPVPKGGITIEMAMSPEQSTPGGWAILDQISNVNYVRNELVVISEFKPKILHIQNFHITESV